MSFSAKERSTFGNLITLTRSCMNAKGSNRTFEDDLKCETAFLSSDDSYTYHTHPNGNPRPSDVDIRTTKRLKKKWLLIGLVPNRTVVGYNADDGFKTLKTKFRV